LKCLLGGQVSAIFVPLGHDDGTPGRRFPERVTEAQRATFVSRRKCDSRVVFLRHAVEGTTPHEGGAHAHSFRLQAAVQARQRQESIRSVACDRPPTEIVLHASCYAPAAQTIASTTSISTSSSSSSSSRYRRELDGVPPAPCPPPFGTTTGAASSRSRSCEGRARARDIKSSRDGQGRQGFISRRRMAIEPEDGAPARPPTSRLPRLSWPRRPVRFGAAAPSTTRR
jgi:hypothetical protein